VGAAGVGPQTETDRIGFNGRVKNAGCYTVNGNVKAAQLKLAATVSKSGLAQFLGTFLRVGRNM